MIYEYWGYSRATNDPVHGYQDANSDPEFFRWLRDNSILVTSHRLYQGSISTKSRLTTGELIDFFSSLEFNGTHNLPKALDGFAALCPNPRFKRVVRLMAAACRDKKTLAAAAAQYPRYFPQWILAFLSAGDQTGTMQASIQQILSVLHADEETDDDLAEGFRTMRNVWRLALLLFALYVYVFLPTIEASLHAMREPIEGLAAWVFGVADFFHNLYVVGAIVILWGLQKLLWPYVDRQPPVRRFRETLLLRSPLMREVVVTDQTARVARMLGNIIPSGISLQRAVEMASSIVTFLVVQVDLKTAIDLAGRTATIAGIFEGTSYFDYRFLLRIEAAKAAPLRPSKDRDGKSIPSQCDACLASADFLNRIKRRKLRFLIQNTATWGIVALMVVLISASLLAFVPYFAIVKRLLIGF